MHLKKIVQKKNNLEKINLKANSEKNILLITIVKLNQKLKFYIDNAFLTRESIRHLNDKYNIQNPFIIDNGKNKFKSTIKGLFSNTIIKEKELWIYLKEEQKYSTDSYSRYEKMILANAKTKKIDFLAIGKKAEEFLKSNNLNILKSFDLEDTTKIRTISTLIKFLYEQEKYKKVNFVLNSNKNYKSYFTILPIENFEMHKLINTNEKNLPKDLFDFNIYPNVAEYVQNSIDIYIENVVQSLIIESLFYSAKLNLVRVNKILKDLEKEIKFTKRKIIKIKRENEIEEIIMLTKNNGNFSVFNKGESNEN
ncbi:MSC_0622 family F1-like ATPase gamma subunit [Mycoplasma sp. 480]|uniref:MSC_0622 family F1-like ATPase gamma subunit n=1 Tax=Mycoplasma sp. 480 TaxID=3440155 RepID=UPI003F516BEF